MKTSPRHISNTFISVIGLTFAMLGSTCLADANVIRGPVIFGPDSRIKLDCPSVPTPSNPVQSEVQGFGHLSQAVKFKLTYKPSLNAVPVDIPNSVQTTKDYVYTLNTFIGNFPGPGYYSLVMRNTNTTSVLLPANEQLGIICH